MAAVNSAVWSTKTRANNVRGKILCNQLTVRCVWRDVDIFNRLDLPALTQQLEDEGIDKFSRPYDKLLVAIGKQAQQLTEG